MTRPRRTLAVLAAAVAILAACSGDDDAGDATTTTVAAEDASPDTTLVDPPGCDELDDPVDGASLEGVGCLEGDGVVAIATTAECPDGDGTVVFISDQMGLEGGEWVAADAEWESLCP